MSWHRLERREYFGYEKDDRELTSTDTEEEGDVDERAGSCHDTYERFDSAERCQHASIERECDL